MDLSKSSATPILTLTRKHGQKGDKSFSFFGITSLIHNHVTLRTVDNNH